MKIVLLNAATLPIYCAELADLLLDVVQDGATVGYPRSITRQQAEISFHRLRGELEQGERLLWIARDEQGITGCVNLLLSKEADALNRATIKMHMVRRRARRSGVGKNLINELEKGAYARQRGLLHLEAQAGSRAEGFYRAQGYRCLGEIPDYLNSADGSSHSAVIYYKRLFAVNHQTRAIAC